MNITEHLQKEFWLRRIVGDKPIARLPKTDNPYYVRPDNEDLLGHYQLLTAEDFADEISPSAHAINSIYQSTRPIQELVDVEITDENGNKTTKKEWKITGYDDLETVALGIQSCISTKKATHFASKGFWVANETKDSESYEILSSWMDTAAFKTAYMEAVTACFQHGDAAIFFYVEGKDIQYQVFSFANGDMLFPDLDENRNPILYRKYSLKGKTAVDVYACGYIETWVNFNVNSETDSTWYAKVKNWFKYAGKTVSEDGFTLISRRDTQVSNDINQCVYFRVKDIPTGVAQQNIEKLEDAISYNAEEVKNTSMPTLFLKAKKIENLPAIGSNGRVIGVRGSSDDLQVADAKYLEGADHSNTYTSHVETLWQNIVRSTLSVFVEPSDMKNGADSSASFKLMFAPEIQWCEAEWPQFVKPCRQLVNVFKQLVGKVEGKSSAFLDLRVSVGLDVWIPENDTDYTSRVISQVNARVMSRKAALSELNNAHLGDYEQIQKEWEDELQIKSEIPAKVNSEYNTAASTTGQSTANEPNPVDKQNRGRSIQDR